MVESGPAPLQVMLAPSHGLSLLVEELNSGPPIRNGIRWPIAVYEPREINQHPHSNVQFAFSVEVYRTIDSHCGTAENIVNVMLTIVAEIKVRNKVIFNLFYFC